MAESPRTPVPRPKTALPPLPAKGALKPVAKSAGPQSSGVAAMPPRVKVSRERSPKGPMARQIQKIERQLGQVDKGLRPLTVVMGFHASDAFALAVYSVKMVKEGDVETAIAAGVLATQCDKTSFDAWVAYGCALAKGKRDAEAIVALRTAIAAQPENMSAHLHLGEVLLRGLDYKGASAELELVMTVDPLAETPEGARAQALVARTLATLGR